jgi:hypothetical protein
MKVKWLLDTGTTAARLVVDSGDLLGDKHGELKEGKRIVLYKHGDLLETKREWWGTGKRRRNSPVEGNGPAAGG